MKETIQNATMRSFVQTVKLDHVVWKGEVYSVASGLSHKSISDFADHNQCRLGKWYNSEGRDAYSSNQQFRQLEEPHRQVHLNGVEALKALQAGDKPKSIEHLQAMEDASVRVMNILDSL